MKSIEIVLCIVLGVTFMTSSMPKLRHPKGFLRTTLACENTARCGELFDPVDDFQVYFGETEYDEKERKVAQFDVQKRRLL